MRQHYLKMKDTNDHYLKQLEKGQQELDKLNMKKTELEEVSRYLPIRRTYFYNKFLPT